MLHPITTGVRSRKSYSIQDLACTIIIGLAHNHHIRAAFVIKGTLKISHYAVHQKQEKDLTAAWNILKVLLGVGR